MLLLVPKEVSKPLPSEWMMSTVLLNQALTLIYLSKLKTENIFLSLSTTGGSWVSSLPSLSCPRTGNWRSRVRWLLKINYQTINCLEITTNINNLGYLYFLLYWYRSNAWKIVYSILLYTFMRMSVEKWTEPSATERSGVCGVEWRGIKGME